MNLKSYHTFEMDLCDLQVLLSEYFAEQTKPTLQKRILFGFPHPTNIKALSVEETIALAHDIDLRPVLEAALMEANKIKIGEAFRILVRATKQNLFDINELQDICRDKYDTIELKPIKFVISD